MRWSTVVMKTLESLRNPRQLIPKQEKKSEKIEVEECIVEKQKVKEAFDNKNDNDRPREGKQKEEEKEDLLEKELEAEELEYRKTQGRDVQEQITKDKKVIKKTITLGEKHEKPKDLNTMTMRYEIKLKDGIVEAKNVLPIKNIEDEATSERTQQPNNQTQTQSKNNYIQLTKFVEDFATQSLKELSSNSSNEDFASERDEEITEMTKMTISPLVQTLEDIIKPLVDMKIDNGKHDKQSSIPAMRFISAQGSNNSTIVSTMRDKNADTWRSVLPITYVWYASYGSNMWKPRFLCYIQGYANGEEGNWSLLKSRNMEDEMQFNPDGQESIQRLPKSRTILEEMQDDLDGEQTI
eukprot:Gb_06991 [translate_table: standard]